MSEDDKELSRPRHGHIHAADVSEEAPSFALASANGGQEDDIILAALHGVNRSDSDTAKSDSSQAAGEGPALCAVRRDDSHATLVDCWAGPAESHCSVDERLDLFQVSPRRVPAAVLGAVHWNEHKRLGEPLSSVLRLQTTAIRESGD